jgi:NTF2 fold immunity protein
MKMPTEYRKILWILVVCLSALGTTGVTRAQGYVPKRGFVPDRKTALAIADAVLQAMLPRSTLSSYRPFKAKLSGNVWNVMSKDLPIDTTGGRIYLRISKTTGAILFLVLTK